MPPRPRPFSNLGSADLVKQLFDAAFASNAARFEDLLFELEGGEDGYTGRGGLSFIKAPLVEAAKRVIETETYI
jgi:hypothetical protein